MDIQSTCDYIRLYSEFLPRNQPSHEQGAPGLVINLLRRQSDDLGDN